MKLTFLKITACVTTPIAMTAYFYAMVIAPFLAGGWDRLQKVWFDWQTFNSAMIALLAAFIGVFITVYLTKSQNRAQFIVARAQLPEALALVGGYLDQYLLVLQEALQKLQTKAGNKQTLNIAKPTLNNEYKSTFGNCIAYGSDELRSALADISKYLQIHKSRLFSLIEQEFHPESQFSIAEIDIISELKSVCKTRALVNKLYPYARFDSEKLDTTLESADIINSAIKLDGNTLEKLNYYLNNKVI